jgi:hypothetical protein
MALEQKSENNRLATELEILYLKLRKLAKSFYRNSRWGDAHHVMILADAASTT